MLKDAVNALRKFGSKSLRKAKQSTRSLNNQEKRWSRKQNKIDCKGSLQELMNDAQILEIDGVERLQEQYQPERKSYAMSIAELADGYLPFEMEDVCPAELESEDMLSCPSMERDTTGMITPESSLSPVSPVSPTQQQWLGYKCKDFDSPISPTDAASAMPWTNESATLSTADLPMLGHVFSYEGVQAGKAPQKDVPIGEWEFATAPMTREPSAVSRTPSIRIQTTFTNDDASIWQNANTSGSSGVPKQDASKVVSSYTSSAGTQSENSPIPPGQFKSDLPNPIKYVEGKTNTLSICLVV